MSRKLSTKPAYLVFIGLTVVVLGVLIPSLFIDPFSTIGLAVIIGSLILLSAYVFFSINIVRTKGKKMIKWSVLPIILILFVCTGIFSYVRYNQFLVDKIYSINDTIHYPGFKLRITKVEIKPASLPLDKSLIEQYGGLDEKENCRELSDKSNPVRELDISENRFVTTMSGASDRDKCKSRNNSRDEIKKYLSSHKQLVIDYAITANTYVKSSGIKLKLLPDSGRNPRDVATDLGTNEYLDGRTLDYKDLYAHIVEYVPYYQSKIGGDISKGITRRAYIYTDVLISEKTVDFMLSYNHGGITDTRTVRVNLKN